MTAWRIAAAVALAAALGVPLLMPFAHLAAQDIPDSPVDTLSQSPWRWSLDDATRIGRLAANTLLLVAGTCVIAVPAGTVLALLLFRAQLRGRRALLALLVFFLFVPLPV